MLLFSPPRKIVAKRKELGKHLYSRSGCAVGYSFSGFALEACLAKEGTIAQIAARFRVSVGYVKKILRQYRRTKKMERIPHHPGRKPLFTESIRGQIRGWLKAEPDLTLVELQGKLLHAEKLKVSVPSLWSVLKKMGLRLKKSRSMRRNKMRPASNSNARSISRR